MAEVLEYIGLFFAALMVLLGLVLILRKPKPQNLPEPSTLEVDGQSLKPIVPRHLRQMPEATADTALQPAMQQPATSETLAATELDEKAQAHQTESDPLAPSLADAVSQTEVADTLPNQAETQPESQQATQHSSQHSSQQAHSAEAEPVVAQPQSETQSELDDFEVLLNSDKVVLADWQGESDILDAHISEQNRQDEESALATAKHFVALYLYPSPNRALSGERVLRLLLKYGLRFGEMSCFHRYQDPEQPSELMFSVLRINDEGAASGFDLETLPSEEVKGLAMFLALPNPHAVQGFDMMASLSGLMAREIDGQLLDEQSLEFTPQLKEHWRHFVIEYKDQA